MRKLLLLLLIPIFLSCTSNEFTFTVDVKANIIGVTNNYIGLQYEIYGNPVFQDIYVPTSAEHAYYASMKTIPLTVKVKGHDRDGHDNIYLTVTHKGSLFGKNNVTYSKLSIHDFMSKDIEIPGFMWEKFADVEYNNAISPQELRVQLKEKGDDVKTPTEQKPEKEQDKKL